MQNVESNASMEINIACTCDCSPLDPALKSTLGHCLPSQLAAKCNWLPYGCATQFSEDPLGVFPTQLTLNAINVLLIQLEDLTVVHPEVRDLPSRKTKLTASIDGSSREMAHVAAAEA